MIFDESIFSIDALPVRSQERNRFVQMDLTVEMNLNYRSVARQIYTILDVLSDIGGI